MKTLLRDAEKRRGRGEMILSNGELERYDRQIQIRDFGLEGQYKLKKAKVTVVGAGGLGCPSSIYLTVAGVGQITIVDGDEVELSNLNRQIGHWSGDVGRSKSVSLTEKLRSLNPYVRVKAVQEPVSRRNARKTVSGSTVVLDCLDDWETRFILNQACVDEGVPLVHAGVHSFFGQITLIMPREGPCLRCILPKTPPEEERVPVLGTTAGILGTLEALEAIKVITNVGVPLIGRMLYFDGDTMRFFEVKVERRGDCPVCRAESNNI